MSDDEIEIVYQNILPTRFPLEVQNSQATVVSHSDPRSSSSNGVPRISIEEAIKIKAQVREHMNERYKELESSSKNKSIGTSNTPVNTSPNTPVNSSPFSCKTNKINNTKKQPSIGNSRNSEKLSFSGDSLRKSKPTTNNSSASSTNPSVNKSPRRKYARSKCFITELLLTNGASDESEAMSSVIEMIKLINNHEYCFQTLKFHSNIVFKNFPYLFCEEEVDIIESFFNMPLVCQDLYKDMYKLRYRWRRFSDYQFNDSLMTNVNILLEKKFILMSLPNWNTATGAVCSRIDGLLEMLKTSELQELCASLNINVTIHRKKRYIEEILQSVVLQTQEEGHKVIPVDDVWKSLTSIMGHCFIVSPEIYGLFQRIHFLFLLKCSENGQHENVSLVSETKYPKYHIDYISNLFSSKDELLRFQRAADLWSEFSELMESKKWNKACKILCTVRQNFIDVLNKTDDGVSALPLCLKEYTCGSLYAYTLHKGIGLEKQCKKREFAIEVLHLLCSQNYYLPYIKGQWYEQLISIYETSGQLEEVAKIIDSAMKDPHLAKQKQTQYKIYNCSIKIVKRKKGVTQNIKSVLLRVLGCIRLFPPMEYREPNIINVQHDRRAGWKQIYSPEESGQEIYFFTIEKLLENHYCSRQFEKGIYGGKDLALSLFCIFFWDVLYEQHVQWAFIRKFLRIPLDLTTGEFYENRQDNIDKKLTEMVVWTSEDIAFWVKKIYTEQKHRTSLLKWSLFPDLNYILDIINCIGWRLVVSICERIATEYRTASSGFPEFFVWSPTKKESKFVQVQYSKIPLATPQMMWRNFLVEKNANFENCHIVVQQMKTAKSSSFPR